MKNFLIAILCLGVVLAGGLAACRGHDLWKQNPGQITNAKLGDSSTISGIWAPTAVSQVRPFVAEEVQLAGAVNFPVRQVSENEARFLQTAHLYPMALELPSTLKPAQAGAPPVSELSIFLTGAGSLGLLLFGAAIHPRRFTVLWIGR